MIIQKIFGLIHELSLQSLKRTDCKMYSERMKGCRDSTTEDKENYRFRLCPKSKDCRWTTPFGQTIPSTVLRDISGALSFANPLPKSPGQLPHPPRKILQTFSFLKLSKYKVPE